MLSIDLITGKSNSSKFSKEDIELCWKWYNAAEPYSKEEIAQIPFDSPEWLDERMRAATAKEVLQYLGLIK